MHAEDLRKLLQRRPFQPLRLLISSGEHVDIRHPEMAIVARSIVAVGIERKPGIAENVVWYNLIHVVKVEPLNGNGHRRRARR